MRTLIFLISLVAAGLLLVVIVSGPGARFGFWHFETGLTLITQIQWPALVVAGLALFALITSLFTARSLAPLAMLAVISGAVASYVPIKMNQLFEENPFIHDITTDFNTPPEIVAAANLNRENPPDYVGLDTMPRSDITIEQAQRDAYPDIKSRKINVRIDQMKMSVAKILRQMDMDILRQGASDDGWVVEAVYTSTWFGFSDDFIVRLMPDGPTTIIDVRSKSRVGGSDLGANAKRIRSFLMRIENLGT